MSLTRAQWVEMWESVKKIEKIATDLTSTKESDISRRTRILFEIGNMKNLIQQVTGQME